MTREDIEAFYENSHMLRDQDKGVISGRNFRELLRLALIGLAVRESGVTADDLKAVTYVCDFGSDAAEKVDGMARALAAALRGEAWR